MTAKKATATKEQNVGIEGRLEELKAEAGAAASRAALEASKIFDAKSAEVADVAQQGDAEIQTIGAEEVGKIDDILGDALPPSPDVPAYSGIEQRLGELETWVKDVVRRQNDMTAGYSEAFSRLEEQVNTKAPEELGEWISDVESKQVQRLAVLESQLSDLVLEHHDRLLQLEMKVTALSGEDEGGPGPG